MNLIFFFMKIKFVHYVCWCDTQIGGFPPIFTDKTHRQLEKKDVKKSADFFVYKCQPIFLSVVISFGGTQALAIKLAPDFRASTMLLGRIVAFILPSMCFLSRDMTL